MRRRRCKISFRNHRDPQLCLQVSFLEIRVHRLKADSRKSPFMISGRSHFRSMFRGREVPDVLSGSKVASTCSWQLAMTLQAASSSPVVIDEGFLLLHTNSAQQACCKLLTSKHEGHAYEELQIQTCAKWIKKIVTRYPNDRKVYMLKESTVWSTQIQQFWQNRPSHKV